MKALSATLLIIAVISASGCTYFEPPAGNENRYCTECKGSGYVHQAVSYGNESSETVYHGGSGTTPCKKCLGKRYLLVKSESKQQFER